MNRAASLSVIAVGAIFAFAITTSPTFLNLHVVGWILMLTGAAGLLLARRSRDWLRRTVIVKGSPDVSAMRSSRRKPAQLPPPDAAGQHTQPLERETVEEYLER